MTISELIRFLQKLEPILEENEDVVVAEGEFFTLTSAPKRPRALTHKKGYKRENVGERIGPNGGRCVMKVTDDPSVWPFEKTSSPTSPRASKIQSAVKSYLKLNGGETKEALHAFLKKELPPKMRKQKDVKGRFLWENTFSALLRNYTMAGYLVMDTNKAGEPVYTLGK
jgi:hypothetical protein